MRRPSDHPRPPPRRGGSILPRCLRCCAGESVPHPQPDVGVPDPQPNVGVPDPQPNVGVANPEPNAITDFADPLSIADPDSNCESHSNSYTEQHGITEAESYSKPFAQLSAGTDAGSDSRADMARHAVPFPGSREEAAPGHRRTFGASNHPGSQPGGWTASQ